MLECSVLVPVCNVERYLEQCLDSLINQTFQNFEIICVDDGSTDESGGILDRYALRDSRIKVIHKKNTGYGNTMNVALDHASGNYIAILESDDFAEPDMLQKLYDSAVAQKADVVKGDYFHYTDSQDVFVNRLRVYEKETVLNVVSCPYILNLADSIWSCLYKRSFLMDYGIRFHETPGASYQDISFALQAWLQAERVYFIEDPLLHYRRDNPGSSMNNPSKLFCVFDEYGWIEEKKKNLLDSSPSVCRHFAASKYRDFLNHYYRVGVQYQYALLVRLEQSLRKDREKGWIEESAFLSDVWAQICEIEADRDRFFKRTARQVPDTRLNDCHIENGQVYEEALFHTLSAYPKVFIYGAGQVGKGLAEVIQRRGGRVDGFFVTRMMEGQSDCMGIPVMEVVEAVSLAESCAVVIAVTEWNQYELYGILETYGFRHIFRADDTVRKAMSQNRNQ